MSRPSRDVAPRDRLLLLGLLFTCTGCTALLAEQAFEKLLSTLVGASTPAAATVLAVYFGGLTLGGLLYGRFRSKRPGRPLRTYALLEGAVALWALFLYLTFDQLVSLFAPVLSLGVDHFWRMQLLRVLVASVWILPATIPMGATFPAIVDSVEQIGGSDHRRMVARFYGFNLLGAIVGSIGGPFYAFPKWGLDGTLLFAFLINADVALIGLLFARWMGRAGRTEEMPQVAAPLAVSSETSLLMAIAVYSGFQFFALEVVWTHLIGTVLGNSVYAFAAMLAMVLIGLGLGAWVTSVRFPGRPHLPVSEVGGLLVAGALLVAITGGRWPDVPGALVTLGHSINSFGSSELLRWSMAALLLVPAAMTLGMVYPTLFRLKEFPLHGSGSVAGRLVAANAIGSIAGALMSGFVLIPRLGSEVTLILLTCLAAALGIWILYTQAVESRRSLILGLLAIAVALLQPRWSRLGLTSGGQVYFGTGPVGPGTVLSFFHEDTLGGFTTVIRNIGERGDPYLTLLTNGKFQGNDAGEMAAQTGFAMTPMMFVPHLDEALSIGLGTGRTAYVLSAMGFRSVDIAEIAPGIVQAAPYFAHTNGSVLRRPNTRLILEDGRNVLLLRPKKYDLITIELSSIWFAGSTNLYSQEFEKLARQRLKPDGVLQQWIQIHHITVDELGTVMATARAVFPYVSFWTVGGQGLVVASSRPQEIQQAFLDAIQAHAREIGWQPEHLENSLTELVSSRLLSPEDVSELVTRQGFVLNTDRNRRLEYLTPRYNHIHYNFGIRNMRILIPFASFAPPRVSPDAQGPLAQVCRRVDKNDYLHAHNIVPAPKR